MASVLYFGNDERLPKMLDQIFQDRLKESGESNSISIAEDEKKLDEFLIGMAFETIFIEQGVLATTPVEWLATLRKKRPSLAKTPMVLVGTEADSVKIFKIIEGGWMDYFLLPPDKPLLIEKVYMYTSGKRSSDVRQVYSMTMSQQADIAKPAIVEELSEFDCKVRSASAIPNNELVVLYAKAFGPDGTNPQPGSVLGRCYGSEKHKGFEGQFQNSFYFVGITPETLTNIRNNLRKQFVSGKSKG